VGRDRAVSAMKLFGLMAIAAVLLPAAAVAQTLDISGPYGNASGCRAVAGVQQSAEDMLVMRADRIEYGDSACDFVQVVKAKNGVSVVTALCDLDGEEGRSVSFFSITPSPTAVATFIIRDEYGAAWDEVRDCAAAPVARRAFVSRPVTEWPGRTRVSVAV
jgi:hypothetical protein